MTLEDIYVTAFNEILSGKYKTVSFKRDSKPDNPDDKQKEKFALTETRNTLLYEWFKDNNKLDLIEGLFDYYLFPKTDPDLSGVDFEELVFVISPETRRALGIEALKHKKKRKS